MGRGLSARPGEVNEMAIDDQNLRILDPIENVNYGSQELMSKRDEQIRDLMLKVVDLGSIDQALNLPRGADRVLNVFAERAASLAVRHRDASELRAGLLAAVLAHEVADDKRDFMPAVSLLHR